MKFSRTKGTWTLQTSCESCETRSSQARFVRITCPVIRTIQAASRLSRSVADGFPGRKLHRVQSLRYEAVSDLGATLVGQCADPRSIGSRLHYSARRMSP